MVHPCRQLSFPWGSSGLSLAGSAGAHVASGAVGTIHRGPARGVPPWSRQTPSPAQAAGGQRDLEDRRHRPLKPPRLEDDRRPPPLPSAGRPAPLSSRSSRAPRRGVCRAERAPRRRRGGRRATTGCRGERTRRHRADREHLCARARWPPSPRPGGRRCPAQHRGPFAEDLRTRSHPKAYRRSAPPWSATGAVEVAANRGPAHSEGIPHSQFTAGRGRHRGPPRLLLRPPLPRPPARLVGGGGGRLPRRGAPGRPHPDAGAVRASCGINTSEADLERLLAAVARIAGGEQPPVAYHQDPRTGDFFPDPDSAVWPSEPGTRGGACSPG
jgi:hypothetical protein